MSDPITGLKAAKGGGAKLAAGLLAGGETEAQAESKLDIIHADDIELELDRVDLVESLLGTGAMSVVYGESGSGKTFWTIDLACHIATNKAWNGLEVTQGVIVYIAAEGPKSVERRVWAWKKHHGIESLPVLVVRSQVDLRKPNASTPVLIEEIKRIEAKYGRVVLIVVDTLSRAMAGGNENGPEDMTGFIGNCDRLRQSTGAHLMIVHHSGKDTAKGSRGHSSLRAATDTEIEVAPGCATVTKQRDLESLSTYGFTLVPVGLGQNARGQPVATCVAKPCAASKAGAGPEKRKLGPNEKIVFDVLCKTLAETDQVSDGPHPQRGARYVTHEQLRVAAAPVLHHPEPKRKNEAFDRALTSLVGNRHIQHIDGRFWIGL